jgi:hypothetical protein
MKKFLCVLAVVVSTACSSGLAPLQQQQQQQQVVIVQVPSAPTAPVAPTQTMVNVTLYLRADTCTGEEIASANVVANGGNYVTGNNGRTSSFSVVSGSVVNWSASRAGYNSRSGSFNAGNGGDFSIFLSRECGTGPVSPPTTPPPPPAVDVCPNISGVQETIPSGMIKDGSGNCVVPPVVCTHSLATNSITASDYHASQGSIDPGASPNTCTSAMASNVSWFIIAIGNGAVNWSSPYSMLENPDTATRNGLVTVTWSDGFVRTIPVTQPGKPAASCSFSITLPPPSTWTNIDKAGTNGSILIGVNGPNPELCISSIETNQGWVVASPASGSGNRTATITVGGNQTIGATPRDFIATIKGNGVVLATINGHQGS